MNRLRAAYLGIVGTPESIEKYNKTHDELGRFASDAAVGIGPGTKGVHGASSVVTEAVKGLPHYGYSIPNDSNVSQANAFEAMVHDPTDPRVVASYDSLEKTLLNQWDHLGKQGFTYEPQGDQPGYASSNELLTALDGKHMRVYLTDGGGDFPADHPMLRPVKVEGLGPRPVLNDVFRAVHDTIGHGVSGGSFGIAGERAAWIAHRETFPREALPALWNETRGQAAWTNAGPHMQALDPMGNINILQPKDAGYLGLPDRPFSEQKAGWPTDFGARV